jgi:hypothetical protein
VNKCRNSDSSRNHKLVKDDPEYQEFSTNSKTPDQGSVKMWRTPVRQAFLKKKLSDTLLPVS